MSESDTQPHKVFSLNEVQDLISKAPVIEIPIKSLIFDEKRYSRQRVDDGAVEDYSHNLLTMPPIVVSPAHLGLSEKELDKRESGKFAITNGVHRYKALLKANQDTARVKIIDIPRNDVDYVGLILDLGYGVRHPESDIKKICVKKFTAKPEIDNLYRDILGVQERTYYDWTKDVRREKQEITHEDMITKYLDATRTQESVAAEYKYTDRRLRQIISDIQEIFADVAKTSAPYRITVKENGKENELQFETIEEYLKHKEMSFLKSALTFKPLLYNIWNIARMDHSTTHFGAFPLSFMQNLLYYHTTPFDVVYDPFAGGGTTVDACKMMIRRYYVSDRKPIGDKTDVIKKWDVNDGLPKDLPKPDFAFLDPPYWVQAKGGYSDDLEDLGNMALDSFYGSMERLVDNLTSKKCEQIAIVIQPTQWGTNENHDWEDHIFKFNEMFPNKYRISARYILPYSTEQYTPQMVDIAKERKFCLSTFRDLVVWRCKK